MNKLLEKLRKSRESKVPIGNYIFTISRPTEMDMITLPEGDQRQLMEALFKFVTGWNVKNLEIDPGGDANIADFDSQLFVEWVNDKAELWSDLIAAIKASYNDHKQKMEDVEKKR